MRSWKAAAKGGTLKRTHVGATCFERVPGMFGVFFSARPRQSAQENDCGARPLVSTWTAWPLHFLSKLWRSGDD